MSAKRSKGPCAAVATATPLLCLVRPQRLSHLVQVRRQSQRDLPRFFIDPGQCPRLSACGGLRLAVERLEVQETLR